MSTVCRRKYSLLLDIKDANCLLDCNGPSTKIVKFMTLGFRYQVGTRLIMYALCIENAIKKIFLLLDIKQTNCMTIMSNVKFIISGFRAQVGTYLHDHVENAI